VFLGAYFGYKKDPVEFPVITSNIPRQIPTQPWYLNPSMCGGWHSSIRCLFRVTLLHHVQHLDGPILLRFWLSHVGICYSDSDLCINHNPIELLPIVSVNSVCFLKIWHLWSYQMFRRLQMVVALFLHCGFNSGVCVSLLCCIFCATWREYVRHLFAVFWVHDGFSSVCSSTIRFMLPSKSIDKSAIIIFGIHRVIEVQRLLISLF